MSRVESRNNSQAIGDNGKAIGLLQIHIEVVTDFNRITGLNFSHQDMFDPVKAKMVCHTYLLHYGRVYQRRTGSAPTNEVFARMWNGGPDGYKKRSTKPYWEKVRHEYQQIGSAH